MDVVVTGASSEYKKSILRFVKVHVNIDTSLYEAKHLHRTHALPTNYSIKLEETAQKRACVASITTVSVHQRFDSLGKARRYQSTSVIARYICTVLDCLSLQHGLNPSYVDHEFESTKQFRWR